MHHLMNDKRSIYILQSSHQFFLGRSPVLLLLHRRTTLDRTSIKHVQTINEWQSPACSPPDANEPAKLRSYWTKCSTFLPDVEGSSAVLTLHYCDPPIRCGMPAHTDGLTDARADTWDRLYFFAEIEEIFCNFEEACAFESDWNATDVWSPSVQRRTKWDNTL